MKGLIIYLSSLFLFLSCTAMENVGGLVTLSISEDISAPLSVDVKSAAEPELSLDEIDAFTLWVEGTKISGTYGEIKDETYKLKVGSYIAHAESCTPEFAETNPDDFGCVRYYGSTEFDVETLKTTQNVEINCQIANSRVVVRLSDDFISYFEEDRTNVRISDVQDMSDRALQMISGGKQTLEGGERTAYFTASDPVYVEVTTRKKGADRDVKYTVKAISAAQSNTSYSISLSVDEDSTSGGISFIVSGADMTTNDFLSIDSYVTVTDFVEDK